MRGAHSLSYSHRASTHFERVPHRVFDLASRIDLTVKRLASGIDFLRGKCQCAIRIAFGTTKESMRAAHCSQRAVRTGHSGQCTRIPADERAFGRLAHFQADGGVFWPMRASSGQCARFLANVRVF
jgi:hypothetical protein